MGIITNMLRQKAVYWAPGTQEFDEYGQPLWADPIAIRCRWIDIQEEFITLAGTRTAVSVRVFVDRDLVVGGLIWLGSLKAARASTFNDDPKEEGAWEIRSFGKVPNRRGTEYLRTVLL